MGSTDNARVTLDEPPRRSSPACAAFRAAGTRLWDEPIAKLSDAVLEEELTIAAVAPGRLRFRRDQDLLRERRKRRVAA